MADPIGIYLGSRELSAETASVDSLKEEIFVVRDEQNQLTMKRKNPGTMVLEDIFAKSAEGTATQVDWTGASQGDIPVYNSITKKPEARNMAYVTPSDDRTALSGTLGVVCVETVESGETISYSVRLKSITEILGGSPLLTDGGDIAWLETQQINIDAESSMKVKMIYDTDPIELPDDLSSVISVINCFKPTKYNYLTEIRENEIARSADEKTEKRTGFIVESVEEQVVKHSLPKRMFTPKKGKLDLVAMIALAFKGLVATGKEISDLKNRMAELEARLAGMNATKK